MGCIAKGTLSLRSASPFSISEISARIGMSASQAVQLLLRLALGWLDHQGSRHREGGRRRVEAVVHQALGDVFDLDTGALLGLAGNQYEFVGDPVPGPRWAHGNVRRRHLAAVGGSGRWNARQMVAAITAEPEIDPGVPGHSEERDGVRGVRRDHAGHGGAAARLGDAPHARREAGRRGEERAEVVTVKLVERDERGRLRLSVKRCCPSGRWRGGRIASNGGGSRGRRVRDDRRRAEHRAGRRWRR